MYVSDRIYKLMEARGLTQTEFCKRTGIPQSTVSEWRRKKLNPSIDRILSICDVLEVSPYELLQDDSKHSLTHEVNYVVVSEGTPGYELLIEFRELTSLQQSRVMAYIQGIKSQS
ncbi:MAG: helix-turn-helix transcriptional regulator [Lachnospiraceae bacterium]|nr:helix-turn-helix transcriptional regulator [Lachnospiraceae bacterium]